MSGKIFINYRQRDAEGTLLPHVLLVESLADRLGTHFGKDTVYLETTLPLAGSIPKRCVREPPRRRC